MTGEQSRQLFATLQREQANVIYVKAPVEFGVAGAPDTGA